MPCPGGAAEMRKKTRQIHRVFPCRITRSPGNAVLRLADGTTSSASRREQSACCRPALPSPLGKCSRLLSFQRMPKDLPNIRSSVQCMSMRASGTQRIQIHRSPYFRRWHLLKPPCTLYQVAETLAPLGLEPARLHAPDPIPPSGMTIHASRPFSLDRESCGSSFHPLPHSG